MCLWLGVEIPLLCVFGCSFGALRAADHCHRKGTDRRTQPFGFSCDVPVDLPKVYQRGHFCNLIRNFRIYLGILGGQEQVRATHCGELHLVTHLECFLVINIDRV